MRLPTVLPFVRFRFSDGHTVLCYSRRRIKPARKRMDRIGQNALVAAILASDQDGAAEVTVQSDGGGRRDILRVSDETASAIWRMVSKEMCDGPGGADGADQGRNAAVVGKEEGDE
jgi:hypothetical protein